MKDSEQVYSPRERKCREQGRQHETQSVLFFAHIAALFEQDKKTFLYLPKTTFAACLYTRMEL
ncbi:hypothetical protein J2X83_003005 [Brevibacillus nitrificans]|nr:hypothetical protein [Brevibacillus nitrificans]